MELAFRIVGYGILLNFSINLILFIFRFFNLKSSITEIIQAILSLALIQCLIFYLIFGCILNINVTGIIIMLIASIVLFF